MDATEARRRQSLEQRLSELLQARPHVWIPMREMHAAGDAWRSRLPQVRQRFAREQIGIVQWNRRNGGASAYMFVPYVPLGRDAGDVINQQTLFELR